MQNQRVLFLLPAHLLGTAVGAQEFEQEGDPQAEDHAQDEGGDEEIQEVAQHAQHAAARRHAHLCLAVALHPAKDKHSLNHYFTLN